MNTVTQDTEKQIVYAGFWIRAGAELLDALILCVPWMIFSMVFFGSLMELAMNPGANIAMQVVGWAAFVAYYGGFLLSRWQATPGKRLVGIYVGRADNGGRISPGQAVMRYAVLWGPVFLVSAVLMAFSPVKPMEPGTMFSQEDQKVFTRLMQKQMHHEALTAEEEKLLEETGQKMQNMTTAILADQAELTPDERERMTEIARKQAAHLTLTEDEQKFRDGVMLRATSSMALWGALSALSWVYIIVVAFMIGLSKQKAGPHDRVARTRVLVGRV